MVMIATLNILKTTDSCTLKGPVLQYLNCISKTVKEVKVLDEKGGHLFLD